MKEVILSLGSNLGNRLENLETAVALLGAIEGVSLKRVSPYYENPALIPNASQPEWDLPFLNSAVSLETKLTASQLLNEIHRIEKQMGRVRKLKWEPRLIDIDLIFSGDDQINEPHLTIPHPQWQNRSFVLDPLKDITGDPDHILRARTMKSHGPLFMGIVNVTPDSFSDGGSFSSPKDIESQFSTFDKLNVHILDLGAESTRPGASPLSWEEEWSRLAVPLEMFRQYFGSRKFRPKLSIDTYHSRTAQRALEWGADIINDVSGLQDPDMVSVLKSSSCDYVLTHSLGAPSNPRVLFEKVSDMDQWFLRKIDSMGIDPSRIILDPGLGFGKTKEQSFGLVNNLSKMLRLPHRLMVGHSRKSFLQKVTDLPAHQRDIESVTVSLHLINQGVDILRVHNPELHIRAYRTHVAISGAQGES